MSDKYAKMLHVKQVSYLLAKVKDRVQQLYWFNLRFNKNEIRRLANLDDIT